jgi:DNA-binding MarR family transcriptional regulator
VSKDEARRLREAFVALIRNFKAPDRHHFGHGQKQPLNPPDTETLLFVGNHPDCMASDVAQYIGVAPTTASSIIDRLVRRDLLSRDRTEENRRVVKLRLTQKGNRATQRIIYLQLTKCAALLITLQPEERQVFLKLISKMASKVSFPSESFHKVRS